MSSGLEVVRAALGGERAWLVGGAIRDRLLGRPTADLDVVVDGDPARAAQTVARAAGRAACFALSENFGAWRVVARDRSWQLDVEPLRGGSLEADLALRDFTVNAIAEPLAGGATIDPLGGIEDLARGSLRMAGPGAFAEDPLRVLRLVRVAVELGLSPEIATLRSAGAHAHALRSVSPERVFIELRRIVAAPAARQGLELMGELGATAVVFPELEDLRGVEQSRYHHLDVYGHTLEVLDRTVEGLEIGLDSGLRTRSEPYGPNHFAVVSSHVLLAQAAFAPIDPSEEVIDGVMSWSTIAPLDRYRTTDRLRDFRISPWGDADGDGAILRLAAAKAALERLIAATPDMGGAPLPNLIVVGGGVFALLPPAIVALAMADLVRRPGVAQLACDHARLLGPLGAIEDEAERRRLLANLADDLLVPIGTLVLPAGVKMGRSAGRLQLRGTKHDAEIELHPGAIQVVDLQAGSTAKAVIDFRETVRLGSRGRHFELDVSGGLGGLLLDLRDVPLRLPDRPEQRRQALEAWQRGMWPEMDE